MSCLILKTVDDKLTLFCNAGEDMFGETIKILITNNFGAGWSSWNMSRGKIADFMLTYQPIIDYLEQPEIKNRGYKEPNGLSEKHPLVKQMLEDVGQKFGEDKAKRVCVLGVKNLVVHEVTFPSLVDAIGLKDYDGKELVNVN